MSWLLTSLTSNHAWAMTVLGSGLICGIAFFALWLAKNYSYAARCKIIATFMLAHLIFAFGFFTLPKLSLKVIPAGWTVASLEPANSKSREPSIPSFDPTFVVSQPPQIDPTLQIAPSLTTNHKTNNDDQDQILSLAASNNVQAKSSFEQFELKHYVLGIWLLGAVSIIGWYGFASYWIRRQVVALDRLVDAQTEALLQQCCQLLSVAKPPKIRIWADQSIPMLSGVADPVIVVPNLFLTWPANKQRHVLMHELAHLRRHDILDATISWIATACFWFNPLIWMLKFRQTQHRELACDEVVLTHLESPENYASDLISVLREASRYAPAVGICMARGSEIQHRVECILRFDPARLTQPKIIAPRLLRAMLVSFAALSSTLVFSQAIPQQVDSKQTNETTSIKPAIDFENELTEHQAESFFSGQQRLRAEYGDRVTAKISASGIVVDSTGTPVAGVPVYLRERPFIRKLDLCYNSYELLRIFENKKRRFIFSQTRTNNKGEFKFENVETPKYFEKTQGFFSPGWSIVVGTTNDHSSISVSNWHHLEQPTPKKPIKIQIPNTESFVGILTDDQGKAIPKANIRLCSICRPSELTDKPFISLSHAEHRQKMLDRFDVGNSPMTTQTTSDANGRFELANLPHGHHVIVEASYPEFMTLRTKPTPISKTSSAPMPLTMQKGWHLRFSALDPDGKPLAGAEFELRGNVSQNFGLEKRLDIEFKTDKDGNYLSPPLPACSVTVSPILNHLNKEKSPKPPKWIATPLEISPGKPRQTKTIKLNVERGRLIHGRIVAAEQSRPITPEQYDNLSVIYIVITDEMFNQPQTYYARPDSTGKFSIRVKDGVEGQIAVVRSSQEYGFDLPAPTESHLFMWRIAQRRVETARLTDGPSTEAKIDPLSLMPSRKNILPEQEYTESSPLILPVARSQAVQGTLVDENGKPVSGATLKMLRRTDTNYGARFLVPFPADPVTDNDGKFTINGIQERFATIIRAVHPTEDLTSDFLLPKRDTDDAQEIRLTLKPGPSVMVVVKLDGKPLSGKTVTLDSSFNNKQLDPRTTQQLRTDQNGICIFKNVPRTSLNFIHITAEAGKFGNRSTRVSTLGENTLYVEVVNL